MRLTYRDHQYPYTIKLSTHFQSTYRHTKTVQPIYKNKNDLDLYTRLTPLSNQFQFTRYSGNPTQPQTFEQSGRPYQSNPMIPKR